MRILVLTAMYPTPDRPAWGTFVHEQVLSLRNAGVEVEVLAFDGDRSLANYLRAGNQLRRKLKKEKFDLVHAHYGLTGLPARMQFRCPVVLTYHGSDLLGQVGEEGSYTLSGRLKVLLSKSLGYMVAERIVVAPLLLNRLWRAEVIPMGVDMEKFQPRPKDAARQALGLDMSRKYVLFVAHPENKGKRFDIASEAVRLASARVPELELLPVFGVPHDKVPRFMNAADALVLTSDHEASPCVIKEALASNLPIVSVDCGDVAERLQGVTGCRLVAQTPIDVAGGLVEIVASALPTNGREIVASISLENTAARTIAVYLRALGGKTT